MSRPTSFQYKSNPGAGATANRNSVARHSVASSANNSPRKSPYKSPYRSPYRSPYKSPSKRYSYNQSPTKSPYGRRSNSQRQFENEPLKGKAKKYLQ